MMLEVAFVCNYFKIILKGLLLAKSINYISQEACTVVDCIQQVFNSAHNLEALEICILNSLGLLL